MDSEPKGRPRMTERRRPRPGKGNAAHALTTPSNLNLDCSASSGEKTLSDQERQQSLAELAELPAGGLARRDHYDPDSTEGATVIALPHCSPGGSARFDKGRSE
jgi:hypothetical protein